MMRRMRDSLRKRTGCVKSPFPPQITRVLQLTAAIVLVYFTARYFLVPASFGQFGWYRGDALKDYAALPISYAGATACAECHAEVVEKKAKAGHKGVPCESCHGALNAHAEDPNVEPPKIADHRFCIRCHEASPSRPEKFPQVKLAKHHDEEACTKCHTPHQPLEEPGK